MGTDPRGNASPSGGNRGKQGRGEKKKKTILVIPRPGNYDNAEEQTVLINNNNEWTGMAAGWTRNNVWKKEQKVGVTSCGFAAAAGA